MNQVNTLKKLGFFGSFAIYLSAWARTFAGNVQRLVIQTEDGTKNIKPLNSLLNFTFADNNLPVKYSIGSVKIYEVLSINRIYFNDAPSGL
ncbi:MAG: hypothetical protein JW973_11595 [Bacteroidales bacterium]|nr:hypothetical protein [Bacteroidales bacterium]